MLLFFSHQVLSVFWKVIAKKKREKEITKSFDTHVDSGWLLIFSHLGGFLSKPLFEKTANAIPIGSEAPILLFFVALKL